MNTPQLILQRLTEKDLTDITETFSFPWTSPKETYAKWESYIRDQQANLRTVCIAKLENEYVGYGSLLYETKYPGFKNMNIPEINDVWILEKYRKKGFGKKLIEHLEAVALKENHALIGIGVGLYKDYGAAQALYIKMGYVPDKNGVTYKGLPVIPGNSYPVDDELIIWLRKKL